MIYGIYGLPTAKSTEWQRVAIKDCDDSDIDELLDKAYRMLKSKARVYTVMAVPRCTSKRIDRDRTWPSV